jgi:hypothetical protein
VSQPKEGWYTDPYAQHEARWLSDDKPTKLVRDGDVESYDDPPSGPPVAIPVALEPDPTAANGEDLIRADSAEQGDDYDPATANMSALDSLGQAGAPNFQRLYDGKEY